MGLLVITDAILNRVTENWKKGKRTHVYLDEFHVVYENPYSSMFFTSAWRRFRKRNAFPTGITQNVEYLLDNASARSLLSNSELIVMHNQASSDRERLAELFNISEDQMKFITNAEAGHGLMKNIYTYRYEFRGWKRLQPRRFYQGHSRPCGILILDCRWACADFGI